MKRKIKKLWFCLRRNVLNRDTLIFFILAEFIFWLPCIITGFLAIIIDPWWWGAFGAICAFWAGPFTPAVPLQIGLIILLKKIFKRRRYNAKSKQNRQGIEYHKKRMD